MSEDDVFHLTPLDVRHQEVRRTLRGYDVQGVEEFRGRVADELERVIRERSVLEERLSALTDQLRGYRERERAMNEALVAAPQLREEMRGAAEREAQVILREAEVHAQRFLDEARNGERAAQDRLAEVERQFHVYVTGFRQLLERQLAELRTLDGSGRST
jgi:DivIVA domain-containing protein